MRGWVLALIVTVAAGTAGAFAWVHHRRRDPDALGDVSRLVQDCFEQAEQLRRDLGLKDEALG